MNKKLSVSLGQYSVTGKKALNQDFHGAFIPQEPQLSVKGIAVALADGISSSQVSQIASETAVKGFIHDFYCTSDLWSVKKSAQRVIQAMNSWLYSQTKNSGFRFDKDKGYICTFSAIVFKSNTAHLFHCGDSRIYRVCDSTLEQLTTDHRHTVSEETSYLTRALGINATIELETKSFLLHEGDTFVLSTDGIHDFLSAKHIAKVISQHDNLNEAAEILVNMALEAGSDDNLTIQIVKIDQLPKQEFDEIKQQVNYLPFAPTLSSRMEFDGFDILREIYMSSRSHVFLARDKTTKQTVVLKFPSTEMQNNQTHLETMLMEDWIATRINNDHVLKAIPMERKRNYLYTVTEYVEGVTLSQWMIDNPKPKLETVRSIIEQIAKALQVFHRQQMVHQDLRPQNIMIDKNNTVKVIDFGATKVAGVSEIAPTNEGLVGTAQYTAPEYFIGEQGTNRSDIYSLGVIAYQLLSGLFPYGTAVSKTHDSRSQMRLKYQPLYSKENIIPNWVDYAINKATAIEPLKRYQEVSEFIHELRTPNRQFLSQARPPLLERDPVKFWQSISLLFLCLYLYQLAS